MNNHHVFIPSHGLGKIYLDLSNMHWYMHNSSYFNLKKEIPFFKFLLDMASLRMRYYTQLNVNRLFLPQIILDIGRRSTYLIRSFIKITSLSKDLFCTGDIEALDYCIEVYRQFNNREPLDFFISDKWELRLAFTKLRDKLFHFEFCLKTLFTLLYSFFPTKSNFRENLIKTEQLFAKDLKYQFKRIIGKNGKCSSGIYGKTRIFLERAKYTYIFDGGSFLKIEKNFVT